MGVISDLKADGSVDRDHLDVYVHGTSEWKIGLYEDGIDCFAPDNGYKYGVENRSAGAGEGQQRKRKARASRVLLTASPVPKKS